MNLLILQLADSAFPTGGFVHSGGLEAAARLGVVSDLHGWLRDSLEQAGHGSLPFATVAHGASELSEIDAYADVWLSNHVANRASRAQGQGLISTAAAVYPQPALLALKRQLRVVNAGGQAAFVGHLAPAFGAICAILGISCAEMQRLFLFLHLRGQISTAVRLGLVGPLEAQRMQAGFQHDFDTVLATCAAFGLADLATTAPLHDIAHAHHDRLYSRLFAS